MMEEVSWTFSGGATGFPCEARDGSYRFRDGVHHTVLWPGYGDPFSNVNAWSSSGDRNEQKTAPMLVSGKTVKSEFDFLFTDLWELRKTKFFQLKVPDFHPPLLMIAITQDGLIVAQALKPDYDKYLNDMHCEFELGEVCYAKWQNIRMSIDFTQEQSKLHVEMSEGKSLEYTSIAVPEKIFLKLGLYHTPSRNKVEPPATMAVRHRNVKLTVS